MKPWVTIAIAVLVIGSKPAVYGATPRANAPASAPSNPDDDRLTFLFMQLAADEASINAVNVALRRAGFKVAESESQFRRAEKGNELMDRNAGGPITYKDFYGKTAKDYVMHDRGSPVYHQVRRPPQFDYIYRANSNLASQARADAEALGKRIDALLARRHQLELYQSGLWLTIAFQPVADREMQYRPLYRFKLKPAQPAAMSNARAEVLRPAILFLRICDRAVSSAMDSVSNDQGGTIGDLDDRMEAAEGEMEETMAQAKLSPDLAVTDLQAADGLLSLSRRIKAQCKNVRDAFRLAQDEGTTGDDARKPLFRGQLQGGLLGISNTLSQLDEQVLALAQDWHIQGEVRIASPDAAKIPRFANRAKAAEPVARSGDGGDTAGAQPPGDVRDSGFIQLTGGGNLSEFKAFRCPFGAPRSRPRRPARPGDWIFDNGTVVGGGAPSLLLTKADDFENFTLRLEAMINDGGNSGVFVVRPYESFEVQIESNGSDPNKTGSIIRGNVAFSRVVHPPPANTWFIIEISVRSGRLTVAINGRKVSEANIGGSAPGAIGFQVRDAATVVRFRKIEVRRLP